MVDAADRDFEPIGEGLGKGYPHEQGTDEAGPLGDGDAAEVFRADGGLLEGFTHHGPDELDVPAGCDLRYHAAEYGMICHLAGDHAGEDLPPVGHHGRCRFVAGCLDRKDITCSFVFPVEG